MNMHINMNKALWLLENKKKTVLTSKELTASKTKLKDAMRGMIEISQVFLGFVESVGLYDDDAVKYQEEV